MISAAATAAWEHWIGVTRSRCHLHFTLEGGSLSAHVALARNVGRRTVERVVADVAGAAPRDVLEVGSSVGFNCIALAERFPRARIVGIEPDGDACRVASAMAADFALANASFTQSRGESLPFPEQSFDWIVCHTVIEHVDDVAACIAEMARVLRPNGRIHLDAPNYLWPWEPHLRIVIPPLCPKPLMRWLAWLQGAGAYVGYAEHLKLVHPLWLERLFIIHGLHWSNRAEIKLRQAAAGDYREIQAYGRAAKLLAVLQSLGLASWVVGALLKIRLYPSLLYTAFKPPIDEGEISV